MIQENVEENPPESNPSSDIPHTNPSTSDKSQHLSVVKSKRIAKSDGLSQPSGLRSSLRLQKKTQGEKRAAAAVPQTQPTIKRRRYVAADSSSDSDNVVLSVKFPSLRTPSKDIPHTSAADNCSASSTDRASSPNAPVDFVTTVVSEDVHFYDATGIGSGDHDPQEPDSQRDSDIHTGHTPQEPSIQSMDEDRVYTFPDEQINSDNASRNLSLTERELGLQLTFFSAAQSMTHLRTSISGWNTQEPSVQSSEAVPQVHVPQEPSDQSSEEHSLTDDDPLLIPPLNSRPLETHISGMNSVPPQTFSDSMILNRSFLKEPPIYLTSESLSYPPLFSSKLSVLSLSSKNERKHLVKRLNYEGQSPELAKGEVVLRKEISSLGKETLTLKSHEAVCVRSDEITLKQHRDLGVFTNDVSGQQPSSSTAHSQDGSSSDNKEAAAPSFMDTLPNSLESLTDRQIRLESEMVKLTAKVDAMDSKLDQILSLLLSGPGHDAKKGEKQSNPDDPDADTDDDPESSRGHKEKETTTATTDAAKTLPQQSTHVAGTSQVNPDSGKSGSREISNTAFLEQVTEAEAKEASTDLIIDSVEEAAKLYQALEIKGSIQKVHYKDPRLLLMDEFAARKILESEFPGEDIEQILQEQKLYLSQV